MEDVLSHNDAMRRTQEREEYIQRQEEACGEKKKLVKHNKKQKKKNKQAEMDAYMNKEQNIYEDQQAAKAAMKHAKEQ